MGAFSTTAKNAMLNSLTVNLLSLHTGDPGASGTSNETTAARQACNFNAAASGVRSLNADVAFTGGAAGGPCTWVGYWTDASPDVFIGADDLTGDQTFNASGQYTVKAAGPTRLVLT